MVRIAGAMHLATIENLSRFGARLVDVPAISIGESIELAVPPTFVPTTATVVHVIDAETAARHDSRVGVIVRFREPIDGPERSERRTLELAGDQLADLVTATLSPVFAGVLSELPSATVLSVFESARKSGRLVLKRDTISATIELLDGQVIGAHWSGGPANPRAIVIDVLGWTEGTFELFPHAVPPAHIDNAATVTELMLERARLHDEGTRRLPTIHQHV